MDEGPSPFDTSSLPLEVATVWGGTRSTLFDFVRFLNDHDTINSTKRPYALCPSPTWDYRSIFEGLGIAVQYLGKIFHCNGFGIGAMAATPNTLSTLVNRYRFERSYSIHGFLQCAMLRWMKSEKSITFVTALHHEHTIKRALVDSFFAKELEYPLGSISAGTHAPYALWQLPPGFMERPQPVESYIRDVFRRSGVLLMKCHGAGSLPEPRAVLFPYVRAYLGCDIETLHRALLRIAEARLSWFAVPE